MSNFYDEEKVCEQQYLKLAPSFHLQTPENFEIIFSNDEEFKLGMNIIGICSKLYPDVKILTFELMSNHLHITASGPEERVRSRSIETYQAFAKEIKESIFYTDDELFSAISKICKTKYGTAYLSAATAEIKIDLARIMRYDYNATAKQIQRMLKISPDVLSSLGIRK